MIPNQLQHEVTMEKPCVEKSHMSFFKRPIRMKRDKKAPPAPLVVNSGLFSINSIPSNKLTTSSSNPIRPKLAINSTHSSLLNSAHDLAPSPQITPTPSSHSGTKFNSLLTAAARSIRTGDSRLFESFQATLSPKPLASQFPTNHPPVQKNPNPHSLKRIPVPTYHPNQIHPPLKSESLTRTASLERPRTAPKHSRTTSLPYSQAPPTLDSRPTSVFKTQSHQDLTDSLEQLSEPERKLAQLFDRLPQSSPIQTNPTPNLQSDHQLTQNKSHHSHPCSPFGSGLFNLRFSNQSHEPNFRTPRSVNKTDPNLNSEQSGVIHLKALGNLPKVDHHTSPSPSLPCLPQLGSQIYRSAPLQPYPSNHFSNPDSSPRSLREAASTPNDFLEPEQQSLSTREAQRRSFQSMPLPALPPPCSPEHHTPPVSPFLELPAILNQPKTGYQLARKQQRPWSIASPGNYSDQNELKSSLSISKASIDKINLLISADQTIFNETRTSPFKFSTSTRRNRHSYPSKSIPNLSPLEWVSGHLKSVYSPIQPDDQSLLPNFPVSSGGLIGQRENEALRLTPCITPSCGNLMFGFRGEVYELDKYQKPTMLDQSSQITNDSHNQDPQIAPSQSSPHPKCSPVLINKTSQIFNLVEHEDGSSTRSSPGSLNPPDGKPIISANPIPDQPSIVPDVLIKAQPESEELGEFIELKEICLIGSDHLDHPPGNLRASTVHLNTTGEFSHTILIEPSSPRNSERNCSTEITSENLSVDRGSSEEESSRLLEDSMKFESGPEPKIINPETSLELAASILGQPVPSISKEIRQGFERIHSLFSDSRSQESVVKDKQEFMTKMLKSIDHHRISGSLKTKDAVIQTDPVEFAMPQNSHDPSTSQPSSIMEPKINNRRIADSLKKLANKNELLDHSKENLPLNLTRHSIQSEQSFVTASRSYGGEGAEENQRESLRSSAEDVRSPRSDYIVERSSLRKQRLSEMSDSNSRFSSTWATHSIHTSQQYPQQSPLRRNTGELHLGIQTKSSTFNESVLDALDKALRAEESFQREKQHLQSVARRQSQTIESLLIDKEVLSLEVSRLTGLVELLARDHNLLNDRIDQAEQASSNQMSSHESPTPDETINYFTATGEKMTTLRNNNNLTEDDHRLKNRRRKGNGGNLTETDEGIMAGDSEDWDDGNEEDGESLCDPEQSSIYVGHQRLSFEFVIESSKDNFEPFSGPCPLLTPTKSRTRLT